MVVSVEDELEIDATRECFLEGLPKFELGEVSELGELFGLTKVLLLLVFVFVEMFDACDGVNWKSSCEKIESCVDIHKLGFHRPKKSSSLEVYISSCRSDNEEFIESSFESQSICLESIQLILDNLFPKI